MAHRGGVGGPEERESLRTTLAESEGEGPSAGCRTADCQELEQGETTTYLSLLFFIFYCHE